MTQKVKTLIRVSLIGGNITIVLFYLLACLVPFLKAGCFWFISMLGLIFPVLFFLIAGLCIYWLIRKPKWAFVYAVALLLSWQQIWVIFGFSNNKGFTVTKKQETLRVLTWNLSSWGKTNKSNGEKTDYRNEMIAVIKKTDADVLCFQEFLFSRETNYRDSVIPELKECGYQYNYFVRFKYSKRLYKTAHITGVVILSKYAITDTAQFNYSDDGNTEPLIYADIQIKNKKLRVFTAHLQSVRFEGNDYEALHKLKEADEINIDQSKSIVRKLKNAYKKRALQAEILHNKIKESPYPVIVCGDFNDVPNSYTYFTIKQNLQDAFLKKGFGFGRTFRFISPTLRIDYILADKKFTVDQYNRITVPYSDHYPIVADIDVTEKN